jgi:hypothetical protein
MSQSCIVDQMVIATAILVGKGRGIGLKFAHHIDANECRCESSRENCRPLEARLLRKAHNCG